MMIEDAHFPRKLLFLQHPMRYKVAYGGRSSGKSWSFARMLLILGGDTKLRILCAREVQKSIKDSVHKLLADQIQLLGIGYFYEILETTIRGRNGTEFLFTGLSSHTVESIKSFEGCDRCWIEEGAVVRKRSWDILIPTIRKEGSEIWVSFNPDLETDDTYQRFVVDPPPDCISTEVNYSDNPWWNPVMEQERQHCQETDPDSYDNIWEGKCRPAVEGAIYYKEIMAAENEGRVCNVPYDPMLKVHVVFDLGWADSLAACLVQRNASEIRIIEYLEASHTKLDIFSAELKRRPYNWGKLWLPHDGFSGRLESGGKSTADILGALGWKIPKREEIAELSVEGGIKNARLMFGRVYFDKTKCNTPESPKDYVEGFGATNLHWNLVECLKRYRRRVNRSTEEASTPLRDANAHGADAFRYICLNAEKMTNEDDVKPRVVTLGYQPLDTMIGY